MTASSMDVDADASTKENVEPSDANARRADVAHRVRVAGAHAAGEREDAERVIRDLLNAIPVPV